MSEQEKILIICNAIKNKGLIKFWYETKTTNDFRTVEPHLLGELIDNGDVALRGWFLPTQIQIGKGMKSGWKTYLVKDISKLIQLETTYKSTRKMYNPNDSKMNRIICRTVKIV